MENDRMDERIEGLIKAEMSGVTVQSVTVKPDLDSDGDRILSIEIVLSGIQGQQVHAKMLGLARHLRSLLAEMHRDEFPIVSFTSDREIPKTTREFA